ncbi:uncharacterized protein EV154DRAFT_523439 [Mucor mucedo]|uniref:uncharacterized protein n=1 Tax=Mucor mucedo TaxID=29922 RepID=UPI00221EE61D|nr:uncharacterized protein EV154DRAFT_523439 [Mucor mucedo]KAI7881522.1 hypothetical protein EV154DRAFT_523439 [Mucor mucedo]
MKQAETESTKGSQSIDEVIALIISAENTSQLKNILVQLNTLTKSNLLSYTTDGLDPLTVLNPSTHSLAYLYFITARCQDANAGTALQLFQILSHFIQVFDIEQVRLSTTHFTLIGKALLHLAKILEKPLLPLTAFSTAIGRFACSTNTLTSLHAPFVQACILAKNYSYPLSILDCDIEIIEPAKYDVNIQNFLQYYYYGSIAYIGNQKYDRALDFLSIVISAPTQKAISAIQVAAYKKFILVSLIYEGQIRALPKYTAQIVEKVCKTQSQPYLNLLKTFNETDLKLFHDHATASSPTFESDKHMGLVKQCFQSLRRKKIKELTNVYITVGLNEMAAKIDTSPQELELILIEMVREIYHRKKTAYAVFIDQPKTNIRLYLNYRPIS